MAYDDWKDLYRRFMNKERMPTPPTKGGLMDIEDLRSRWRPTPQKPVSSTLTARNRVPSPGDIEAMRFRGRGGGRGNIPPAFQSRFGSQASVMNPQYALDIRGRPLYSGPVGAVSAQEMASAAPFFDPNNPFSTAAYARKMRAFGEGGGLYPAVPTAYYDLPGGSGQPVPGMAEPPLYLLPGSPATRGMHFAPQTPPILRSELTANEAARLQPAPDNMYDIEDLRVRMREYDKARLGLANEEPVAMPAYTGGGGGGGYGGGGYPYPSYPDYGPSKPADWWYNMMTWRI